MLEKLKFKQIRRHASHISFLAHMKSGSIIQLTLLILLKK